MTCAPAANLSEAGSVLQIELVESLDGLDALTPAWLELLELGASGYSVHNDPRMIADQTKLDPNQEILIFVIRQGKQLVCVAPFRVCREQFRMALSVWTLNVASARVLRLIGDEVVLDRAANWSECVSLVLQELKSRRDEFDYWDISGATWYDDWVANRRKGGRRDGFLRPMIVRRTVNHRIQLPQTADEYCAMLSPSTRQNLRRTTRRFLEKNNGRIVKCSTPDDVPRLLDWTQQIRANSWQGRTFSRLDSGCDSLRDLLAEIAKHGWLRSYVLFDGDQPVAYEHGYVYRHTYYGLECAYDSRWISAGPGSIVLFLAIQDLIEKESTNTLDFGVGDMPYKQTFGNWRQDLTALRLVPANAWRFAFAVQQWVDSIEIQFRRLLVYFHVDRLVRTWVKRKRS
jgi:CelD/BcsL family acetyltransferase involved in cellulose biosynthesis